MAKIKDKIYDLLIILGLGFLILQISVIKNSEPPVNDVNANKTVIEQGNNIQVKNEETPEVKEPEEELQTNVKSTTLNL